MPSDNELLPTSETPFFERLAKASPEEQEAFWADVRGMIEEDRQRTPTRTPTGRDEELLSRLD
jgi:hypothetical protein